MVWHCLPSSNWTDGSLAEEARQLEKIDGATKSKSTLPMSTTCSIQLTAFFAEPGSVVVDGLAGGAVDDLCLPVIDDPVDAVVVRLGGLPRLRGRRGVEVGSVDEVLRRERLDERSDALVHGPLHVTCE